MNVACSFPEGTLMLTSPSSVPPSVNEFCPNAMLAVLNARPPESIVTEPSFSTLTPPLPTVTPFTLSAALPLDSVSFHAFTSFNSVFMASMDDPWLALMMSAMSASTPTTKMEPTSSAVWLEVEEAPLPRSATVGKEVMESDMLMADKERGGGGGVVYKVCVLKEAGEICLGGSRTAATKPAKLHALASLPSRCGDGGDGGDCVIVNTLAAHQRINVARRVTQALESATHCAEWRGAPYTMYDTRVHRKQMTSTAEEERVW